MVTWLETKDVVLFTVMVIVVTLLAEAYKDQIMASFTTMSQFSKYIWLACCVVSFFLGQLTVKVKMAWQFNSWLNQ